MWKISGANRGGSSWSEERIFGIPGIKPIWKNNALIPEAGLSDICIVDDNLYVSSMYRNILSFNLPDGKKLFETRLPHETGHGLSVDEEYIWAPPCLLNRSNGEVVHDLVEDLDIKFNDRTISLLTEGGYIMMADNASPHIVYFKNGNELFFSNHTLVNDFMVSWDESDLVYGYIDNHVACLDLRNDKLLWQVALPVARNGDLMSIPYHPIVIEDRVYVHVNYDTLWCLDATTGEFIWKRGPDQIEQNANDHECHPMNEFFACDDRLYLARFDTGKKTPLACYDINNGEQLWEVETKDSRMGCIAGDLIFGSMSDVPVAWDRYNGEVVWHAHNAVSPHFHTIASGNKVVYTTTTSAVYCYQCDEPYYSPDRPE